MKKIILWFLNIASLILGIFVGIIWFNHLGLDYNSEGKYFDERNAVVYDRDGLFAYGILTLIFVLVGLFSWIITFRTKRPLTND